jgi:hypothetical protein
VTPEERDRQLVEEAFRETRAAPAPDLAERVRERVRRERLRDAAERGLLAFVLAGGGAVVLLVAGLLVQSGYLDLPMDPRPHDAPAGSTMERQVPETAVEPTFLLPQAGEAPGAGSGPGPLRRLDWSGRALGSFTPPAGAANPGVSPDGSLVAVPDAGGPGATILDATGRPVAHVARFGAWSADGAHAVCGLDLTSTPARVELTDLDAPGGSRTRSAAVTGAGVPDARWTLWGCSAGDNGLVALRLERDGRGPYAVAEATRIQLSSGRVLAHVDDAGGPTAPVLSHNARYLAENDESGRTAAIRDLTTGEVLGHVAGLVVAFTGDDRLVLTNRPGSTSGPAPRAALVDWRWGRTVWAGDGRAEPLATRPGGRDVVLSLTPPAGDSRTLLVTPEQGQVVDLGPPAAGQPLQG